MGKHSFESSQGPTVQEVPLLAPYEEPRLEPGAKGLPYEAPKTLYGNGLDLQAELQDRATKTEETPGSQIEVQAQASQEVQIPVQRQEAVQALTDKALQSAVGADALLNHDLLTQEGIGYTPQVYGSGEDLTKRQ